MTTKLKHIITASIIAGCSLTLPKTQAQETLQKYITEITYTRENNILKVRLFNYTAPSNTQRTDLLIGRKIDNTTIYLYIKSDNKERSWAGIRADYNIDFIKKSSTSISRQGCLKDSTRNQKKRYI